MASWAQQQGRAVLQLMQSMRAQGKLCPAAKHKPGLSCCCDRSHKTRAASRKLPKATSSGVQGQDAGSTNSIGLLAWSFKLKLNPRKPIVTVVGGTGKRPAAQPLAAKSKGMEM